MQTGSRLLSKEFPAEGYRMFESEFSESMDSVVSRTNSKQLLLRAGREMERRGLPVSDDVGFFHPSLKRAFDCVSRSHFAGHANLRWKRQLDTVSHPDVAESKRRNVTLGTRQLTGKKRQR